LEIAHRESRDAENVLFDKDYKDYEQDVRYFRNQVTHFTNQVALQELDLSDLEDIRVTCEELLEIKLNALTAAKKMKAKFDD
jgi:hypothetical protein